MELVFLQPWLVIAAGAIAVVAGGFAWRTRRAAPMLFALSAAAFFFAGARPQIGSRADEVRHALVIDVSGSMETQNLDESAWSQIEFPPGHSFLRFELSDAARQPGAARGSTTDYARIADIAADERINGEIIFVTDGRGSLEDLFAAVGPRRLILLRATAPESPDAAVSSLRAPTAASVGTNIQLEAMIRCDVDAPVPWRLMDGAGAVSQGTLPVRAGIPAMLRQAYLAQQNGLTRLRLVLALPDDREPRNDEASVAVLVGGKRRILYCTEPGIPAEVDALLNLLTSNPANEVSTQSVLPVSRSELAETDVVFINNLSLAEANTSSQELSALSEWVSAGGSLFMLGAEGAFGPGGYRGSPLEPLMPVRFRPEDTPPRQTLLLLDVSSSMNDPLAGGDTKLARLKQAGMRVLDSMNSDDRVAVAGFRERLLGSAGFSPASDERLADEIAGLAAGGSTYIARSLLQGVGLFDSANEGSSILMITDGQDVENPGTGAFAAIARELAARKVRLDIVLTSGDEFPWVSWLQKDLAGADVHVWSVGDEGFEGLLQTLDKALSGSDLEWVVDKGATVTGVTEKLPKFVRCAPRSEASVTTALTATYETRVYPLLCWRQLVGRTASLCAPSWGGEQSAALWQDRYFREQLQHAVDFVLANAGRVNLVLNPIEEGAELVWTGTGDAPKSDLRLEPAGIARLDSPGRWLLDFWPVAEELRVFDGDRIIQRIPLPRLVPLELQATGDDEVFFQIAQEGGIRVFRSLQAWQPRRVVQAETRPTDITWLPALLAMMFLLTGFAVRRK